MATKTANSAIEIPRKSRLRDPYILHRLHSASGIFPIGLFLVQHLIANSYALRSPQAFNTVINVFGYLPFVAFLEVFIIFVPILYHSIYGFYIAATGQSNVSAYGGARNWAYLMQRISGVIAFFYIGWHVYHTSVQKYVLELQGNPHPETAIQFSSMASQMSHPLFLAFYIVGITATVFHFTNGMWNFGIRWGLTISGRSQRLSSVICWSVFAVLTTVGVSTAVHFHNAGVDAQSHSAQSVVHSVSYGKAV